jgi:2-phosphosulfolactate phosphatase
VRFVELLFSPAEFAALAHRDLSRTTCVVFDVLRATSTMLEALSNGAAAVLPAADIPEALALKQRHPQALLAGERNGVRITATVSGGTEFDLGNSPHEFTRDRVLGRQIIMTTTNGTRALRACAGSHAVLIASFANIQAVSEWICRQPPQHLLLVCSGTGDHASYEDALGAGALADRLAPMLTDWRIDDAVNMVRNLYRAGSADLMETIRYARNGRRLLELPEFAPDVGLCLKLDRLKVVAGMNGEGLILPYPPN